MNNYVNDIQFTLESIGDIVGNEAAELRGLLKRGLSLRQIASVYCDDGISGSKAIKQLKAKFTKYGIPYGRCCVCGKSKPAKNILFCSRDCRNIYLRSVVKQGWTVQKPVASLV